jgi:hypothetical protein
MDISPQHGGSYSQKFWQKLKIEILKTKTGNKGNGHLSTARWVIFPKVLAKTQN